MKISKFILTFSVVNSLLSGFLIGFETRKKIEIIENKNWFYYDVDTSSETAGAFLAQFKDTFSGIQCAYPTKALIKENKMIKRKIILYTEDPKYGSNFSFYGPPELFDFFRNCRYVKHIAVYEDSE